MPTLTETRLDRAIQRHAERVYMEDEATAVQAASILATARAEISTLNFHAGYPVAGYDLADVLSLLTDMTPQVGTRAFMDGLTERAGEIANDAATDGMLEAA